MKNWFLGCLAAAIIVAGQIWLFCPDDGRAAETMTASSDWEKILSAVEKQYDVPGFTADFYQESTLKALQITDTAHGRIYVRRPNMMRWQYDKPYRKIFITNGVRLWVYLPEDNQVQVGQFGTYFGDGKGAGFLSDIRILRKKFSISKGANAEDCCHVLRLSPKQETPEISEIRLHVGKSNNIIKKIAVVNVYGDENHIELINSQFGIDKSASFFTFAIPEGADVIPLD